MNEYVREIDQATLREVGHADAVERRLAEIGATRSLEALGEKTTLLRLAGRIDEAMTIANETVRAARFDGDRERLVRARIRRAIVLQYTGKHDSAIVELGDCAMEATGHEWTSTAADALEYRAKVLFEMGRFDEAAHDFDESLVLRIRDHAPPEQIDRTMSAISVVLAKIDGSRD